MLGQLAAATGAASLQPQSGLPWRDGGVYLLSGSVEGIGLILAGEIVKRARGVRVALIGQESAGESLRRQLQALRNVDLEAVVEYRTLDMGDERSIGDYVQRIVGRYGSLDGIVHCVKALERELLAPVDDAGLCQALALTVRQTLNVDAATHELPLRWMTLLSWTRAAVERLTEGDCTAGFADGYAAYRNELVGLGRRRGRTLSINCPVTEDGAARAETADRGLPWQGPCAVQQSRAVLDALCAAWLSGETQVLVLPHSAELIQDRLELRGLAGADGPADQGLRWPEPEAVPEGAVSWTTAGGEVLLERVRSRVIRVIANQLKLPEQEIDTDAELGELGFDSLSLRALAEALNRSCGVELKPTVFFEYPTAQRLSEHLSQCHRQTLTKKFFSRDDSGFVETARREQLRSPVRADVQGLAPEARAERSQTIRDASDPVEGVAIIGMSGTFPGAVDLDAFWGVLEQGKDCITEIPVDRWEWRAIYGDPRRQANKTNIKWGGFIEGVYEFDPLFFRISPMEAQGMDPQQRLLLSYAWNALEEAGYSAQSLSGSRTAVFVGMGSSGYGERLSQASIELDNPTGIATSMGPNRLSFLLNLHGPSTPVDTACSSSLVALHRAVRAIQSGDCEMALVGGINTLLSPRIHIQFSKAGVLSEDGRCKTFSKEANGYVRGEGVGMLLLKKLEPARRDGDHIHAVIRGTAENHGGRASSLTAPNPKAQAALLRAAYQEARIDPGTVSYVETHGTGTALGDPIEIDGLKSAFEQLSELRRQPPRPYHCALGSVKTNIGHLEAAAGVAGVIKVLLQMKHRVLVPTLHCQEINPLIDLKDSPFYIVNQRCAWDAQPDQRGSESPRRAGVSSFSIGGVNAHVVLEEYRPQPAEQSRARPGGPALIVLSARTAEALEERVRQLLTHIRSEKVSEDDLIDLAYTLQVGREPMEHRLALTVRSMRELRDKLAGFVEGEVQRDEIEECYRGAAKQNRELLSVFDADEDTYGLIQKWLTKGKSGHVLRLWSRGLMVPWQRLYAEGGLYAGALPRRLSLPTYPFAKARYCPELSESGARPDSLDRAGSQPPQEGASRLDDATPATGAAQTRPLLYAEDWQESALSGAPLAARPSTIAVVLSDRTCQEELLGTLASVDRSAKTRVIFITDTPQSYAQAFDRMRAEHGEIDAVWYLRAVEDSNLVSDHATIARLIQGLAGAGLKRVRIWLCGEYASEREHCHLEAWLGYARSVGRILPEMRLAVIQAPQAPAAGGLISRWTRRLWDELEVPEPQSAWYEGGKRKVPRIRALDFPAVRAASESFRQNGVYLVTGGLGALGYAIATHLARNYHARLVLTGRSVLDADREARVRSLRSLGGDAVYEAADVGNRDQMTAVLQRARERFGSLHGVIHAAGMSPGRAGILERDAEDIRGVLAPKIAGTEALAELVQQEPLDFLCHFSSLSAVLGDFGSCDYAVGSRFELAHAKSTQGVLTLCWPLWADGGMRLGQQAQQLYLRATGQRPLELAEGLQVLEELIARHRAGELSHALVLVCERRSANQLLGVPEASGGKPLRGRTVCESLVWELQQLAGDLLQLRHDEVELESNLADFGFDSMRLATFARKISEHFAVELLPSVFFSHSSLQKLAAHLESEYGMQIRRRYADALPPGSAIAVQQQVTVTPTDAADPTLQTQSEIAPNGEEPIAIVGMSGRFPQARDVAELWQILAAGREAVEEIPAERFDWRDYYQAPDGDGKGATGKSCSKWLGALPGVDEFDPLFFEISPKEARLMDPRQRLLLQESFRALEDAGYASGQLSAGKVAMFVGVEHGEYQKLLGAEGSVTANHDGILAARLSYFLNLRGPVMALNTACSSGLVAVHQACMSLRAQECDTAIAGAANLMLRPESYVALSAAGMLSPRGRCHAFSRDADGMVPGEAVAVLILKRLSKAQGEGDLIYAVIRGSGINHDGRTNGMTAPNGAAQAQLIEETYRRAGIRPEQIEYIATHGTGTRLGDPVEINALRDAFLSGMERPPQSPFCALTSTKTNLGHTFAASGLVSLIGLVQSLRHQVIPASLHCGELSDYIDWPRSPFYVNRQNTPWPVTATRRRLGAVSAFGISGTNAHVVLEGYEEGSDCRPPASVAPSFVLAVSAKTEAALGRRIEDLLTVLRDPERTWNQTALASLSYTLLVHRTHFAHRCALVVEDEVQAIELLEKARSGEKAPLLFAGRVSPGFSGQPVLQQYAAELLSRLPQQQGDSHAYRQSLAALAELQCQGYAFDWRPLSGARAPPRMRLPAYSFDRHRYWAGKDRSAAPARAATVTSDNAEPRVLHGARAVAHRAEDPAGTLRLTPVWEPVALKGTRVNLVPDGGVVCIGGSAAQRAAIGSHFPNAVYLSDEANVAIATRVEQFERHAPLDTVICLFAEVHSESVAAEEMITAQRGGVIGCFRVVKALLQLGYRSRKLNFYAVTTRAHAITQVERIGPAHAAVDGLVGSLSKECPHWNVVSADLQFQDELPARELFSLPKSPRSHLWVYRSGQWYQHQLIMVDAGETRHGAWRRGGVYVVLGGAGRIGEAVSEHLIREYQAQLIWIGRRTEDDAIREKIRRLGALGPAPEYCSADASDRTVMESVRARVKARHGCIHGVVHATMVFSEQTLERMDEGEFESALYAKVATSVRLAQVFAGEPLDFVLFFSSLISFIKNVGQSHYAAGCTFADAFAHQLRNEWGCAVKVMNWGFWGVGGAMSIRGSRFEDVGLAPIEPREAMQALADLIGGALNQSALMRTTRAVPIEGLLASEIIRPSSQTAPAVPTALWLESRLGG